MRRPPAVAPGMRPRWWPAVILTPDQLVPVAAVKESVVTADEPVIGVVIGDEARAYPVEILSMHEVVNDEVAGVAIAITWCSRCQTAIVYSRKVGEQTLTIGNTRTLRDGSMLLYDCETQSRWVQTTGKAVRGPRELTPIDSELTRWSTWMERHPATAVLIGERPDELRVHNFKVWTPEWLARMGLFARIGKVARAYPLDLMERLGMVEEEVEGEPVIAVFARQQGVLRIFRREIDGKPLALELARDGAGDSGALELRERGGTRRFDAVTGRPLGGTTQGALQPLPTSSILLESFRAHFPKGAVYQEPAAGG